MNPFDNFFEYPGRAVEDDKFFLSSFSDEDWTEFLKYAVTEYCEAGVEVAHFLESDRCLYIVVSGEFEVVVPLGTNETKMLATISSGSIFGELGFFDGKPRSASVIATKESEILKLSQKEFEKMMSQSPLLSQQLLLELGRLLASRFRDLVAKQALIHE